MNKIFKNILPVAAVLLSMGMTSCLNDLHVTPIDPGQQTEIEADQLFNKCYANFGAAGNGGANGDCDVDGIDGGTSGLYRQYWNSQELPTDEAFCGWGDEGIPSFCQNSYDASHPMLKGYYYRLYAGVAFCNQYLAQFAEEDAQKTAEIRFLRAFQYQLLMDAFGNVPFATAITAEKPKQASSTEMFNFIESELKAILGENSEDNANVLADAQPHKKGEDRYGRVDKAAAWQLLARMYLNAKTYTGTERLDDAANYAKKVIDSPYVLNTTGTSTSVEITDPASGNKLVQTLEYTPYQMLFMGDNDHTSAHTEGVFTILSDGLRTTSWGVSLFLIASTHDGDMHDFEYDEFFTEESNRSVNGVSGQAWGGNRARPQLIRKFFPNDDAPEAASYEMYRAAEDDRALFDSKGRSIDIVDGSAFKNGYGVAKFNNLTTDNKATSDATFPDMDVFMLRSAEAYLIYAEAMARKGDLVTACTYVNKLRTRANAAPFDYITLSDICDEWSREFYFEGLRRTTLIRFGYFGGTSSYTWQWKGGKFEGRDFEEYRNLYAIPTSDLIANSNLTQNQGYK